MCVPVNESHALSPATFAPCRVASTSATPWSHIQPDAYCTLGLLSSTKDMAAVKASGIPEAGAQR